MTPLSPMMGDVAAALLGDPNNKLSKPRDGILRFGNRGSVEVNVLEGWFSDYETGTKGGVLDLIKHKGGAPDDASAFRWLEEHGIKEPTEATETASTFYDYRDESGDVAFRVERKLRGKEKTFLQHGPNGLGEFHCIPGCMQGVRRVLYRLPELMAADPAEIVFYCEGEKDADSLMKRGLVATTHPGGAGKFDAVADCIRTHLQGRRVIVLQDNDEAGEKHAKAGVALIGAVAASCSGLLLPGLPDKGDVSDWLAMGGSAFELVQRAEAALSQGLDLLPVVNFADWHGNPPARRSAWGDLLPLHTTTMLTGPGGVGKSLFEQMLLTCIALGLPFLGQSVEQMNALYITCEDDTAEIWRRQCAINAMLGVGMADLQGKLHLVSLAGEADTALATFNDAGQVKPTARWRSIEATCEALNIRAFAFDNATDAMAGDLNDLHQVAEFVSMMTGLAIRRDGVAMILHHPNKAGDEWLGSVAWHNKVRSRLIIERPDEHDPDLRCVKNPKANYGPSGGEIRFRWHEGAFARDEDLSDDTASKLRELSVCNAQNSAFLACLREREKQGVERMVGPSTGPNYAPSQFEGMPQAKGYKRQALKLAMDRLFDLGVIKAIQVERPGKSMTKTVIVEAFPNARTDFPNAAPNASLTRFPNGPERQPERSLSYPVYPTDNNGAAHEPAAPDTDDLDGERK